MSECSHLQALTQFLVSLSGSKRGQRSSSGDEEGSDTLTELYGYTAGCVAVFRCLSPLARLVVQRLLFVDGAVPSDVMDNWFTERERKKVPGIRAELVRLNILDGDCDDFVLNPSFVDGLQSAVLGLKKVPGIRAELVRLNILDGDCDDFVLNPSFVDGLQSAVLGLKKVPGIRAELVRLNILDGDCDDFVLNPSFVDGLQSAVLGLKKVPGIRAELVRLNILDGDCDDFVLNPSFVDGLQSAVLGLASSSTSMFMRGDIDPKHLKTPEELTAYGSQRWECVLYYLALSNASDAVQISKECRDILVSSGFVNLNPGQDSVEITSKGFRFLLMEPQSQVWGYLLLYLRFLKERGKDIAECLAFLFQLSQSQLGVAYNSEHFSTGIQDFLQHLREIGLVYQAKRKLMRFFPTHLATGLLAEDGAHMTAATLAGGASSSGGQQKGTTGFLVVETNFRLYAYTDSNLMLAIVSTFTDMSYRFSGMSVGVLTRESVRKALQAGITAEQMIEFIRTNAHEAMQNNIPLIPPNITDQLRLWEQERERFTFQDGVLYSQFLSDGDFEKLRDYAQSLGPGGQDAGGPSSSHTSGDGENPPLLWDNFSSRTMIVDVEYHDDVKRYWKAYKGKD